MPQSDEPQANNSPQHEKHNREPDPGLWLIIGLGFIALAVVVITGIWFVNEQKIRFVTEFSLTVVLATLITVQAYIYRRQWETMTHQWLAMKEQTDIMRNALTENRDIFYTGQRAYIGVVGVRFAEDAYLAIGREPIVHITTINAGKTPAWSISARAHLVIGPETPEYLTPDESNDIEPTHLSHVMLPGVEKELVIETHVKITQEQMSKIINNEEYFL